MRRWSDLSPTTKSSFAIAGTSLLAAPVGIGAVFCANEYLPHQTTGVKKAIATHVVMPHLEAFEKAFAGIHKANALHDLQKRAMLIKEGAPIPADPSKPKTREERAFAIANDLVDDSIALTWDIGAAAVLQKMFKVKDVKAIAITDVVATVGSMIAMPTVFARKSEYIHHDLLRKGLYKKLGFAPDDADRLAVATTYVTIPSLIGMVAGIGANHVMAR